MGSGDILLGVYRATVQTPLHLTAILSNTVSSLQMYSILIHSVPIGPSR